MKVKDLIKELKKLDGEMQVYHAEPIYEYSADRIGDSFTDLELNIEQDLHDINVLVFKSKGE